MVAAALLPAFFVEGDRSPMLRRRAMQALWDSSTLRLQKRHMSQLRDANFPAAAIPADIGDRIKRLRKELDWKQSDLAERSGIAMATISKIENYQEGVRGRMPRADTVLDLLRAMARAGAEFEMKEVVPDWPEATPGVAFGVGPMSRVRRKKLNLSLEEVAAKAGIKVATLSRFERNTGSSSVLLKFSDVGKDKGMPKLCHKGLALALGFNSIEEHSIWCIDND